MNVQGIRQWNPPFGRNASEGKMQRSPETQERSNQEKFSNATVFRLTPRENEIVAMVRQGMSDKEIACRLFISVYTQKAHIRSIHKKLQVKTRAELVAKLNRPADNHFTPRS